MILCPYNSHTVTSMWCSPSVLHSLLLLLHLQFHQLSTSHHFFSLSFTFFSQVTFSVFNVVFFFSASLSAFAPSAPIPLPVNKSPCLPFLFPFTLYFILTMQIQYSQCGILFQHITYCFCSFSSNSIICQQVINDLFYYLFIFSFSSYVLPNSRDVKHVFVIKASHNAKAPGYPIPCSVHQHLIVCCIMIIFIHVYHTFQLKCFQSFCFTIFKCFEHFISTTRVKQSVFMHMVMQSVIVFLYLFHSQSHE